jgi:hypothetical protein
MKLPQNRRSLSAERRSYCVSNLEAGTSPSSDVPDLRTSQNSSTESAPGNLQAMPMTAIAFSGYMTSCRARSKGVDVPGVLGGLCSMSLLRKGLLEPAFTTFNAACRIRDGGIDEVVPKERTHGAFDRRRSDEVEVIHRCQCATVVMMFCRTCFCKISPVKLCPSLLDLIGTSSLSAGGN